RQGLDDATHRTPLKNGSQAPNNPSAEPINTPDRWCVAINRLADIARGIDPLAPQPGLVIEAARIGRTVRRRQLDLDPNTIPGLQIRRIPVPRQAQPPYRSLRFNHEAGTIWL